MPDESMSDLELEPEVVPVAEEPADAGSPPVGADPTTAAVYWSCRMGDFPEKVVEAPDADAARAGYLKALKVFATALPIAVSLIPDFGGPADWPVPE